jgi:hypothetical protein
LILRSRAITDRLTSSGLFSHNICSRWAERAQDLETNYREAHKLWKGYYPEPQFPDLPPPKPAAAAKKQTPAQALADLLVKIKEVENPDDVARQSYYQENGELKPFWRDSLKRWKKEQAKLEKEVGV